MNRSIHNYHAIAIRVEIISVEQIWRGSWEEMIQPNLQNRTQRQKHNMLARQMFNSQSTINTSIKAFKYSIELKYRILPKTT
jgi:hypothetical protein